MAVVNYEIVPANSKMIKEACTRYHYAESIPIGRKMSFAIYENKIFRGVIIYSLGANPHIGSSFGLHQGEVVELTRVALQKHNNPVSFYLSKTFELIKKFSPSVRIIVSYADMNQGHEGKIYQASNWIYLGVSEIDNYEYFDGVKWRHNRIFTKEEKAKMPRRKTGNKHKYIFCLYKKDRKEWIKKGLPYP